MKSRDQMGFQEVERRFAELKHRHNAKEITDEHFDTERRALVVWDERGRPWAQSRSTGQWLYYDEEVEEWKPGTPPHHRGGFLGQRMPAWFSYSIIGWVLVLAYPWVSIAEISYPTPLQYFVMVFVLSLPGSLSAIRVERWRAALGRSAFTGLLGGAACALADVIWQAQNPRLDYSSLGELASMAVLAFTLTFSGVIARTLDRPHFPIWVSLLIGSVVAAIISLPLAVSELLWGD